jgi:hypothetical protein
MATKAKTLITVEMVDELAQVRDKLRALAAREKHLKDAFRASGAGIYRGEHYQIQIGFSTQNRVDMDAVRDTLGEAWIQEHTKPVEVMNIGQMEIVK